MDENSTLIKDRILLIADYKQISKENLIESLNQKYSNYRGLSKKSAPSAEVIAEISTKYPEVNLKWVLTGKGDMLKDDPHDTQKLQSIEQYRTYSPEEGIPLLPIEAFAGFAKGEVQVLNQEGERYVIPMFRDADFLLTVRGSSMVPKYNSGDLVACKKMAVDSFFQWNKVYALDTDQGALIKRVRKGKDQDHLLIVSDNTNYDPFDLHKRHVHSVAMVIGTIRLE